MTEGIILDVVSSRSFHTGTHPVATRAGNPNGRSRFSRLVTPGSLVHTVTEDIKGIDVITK